MAWCRWATMDSHNPFSWSFWRWGNLFGKSKKESIFDTKKTFIDALYAKLRIQPHYKVLTEIICPLTKTQVQQPVITTDGVVYEKTALLKLLIQTARVSGSKGNISKSDIYDFSELNGLLQFATYRQEKYTTEYDKHITKAATAVRYDKGLEYAPIFICPLSGKLMSQCVITPLGQIYDKEAILAYLEKYPDNQYDPINGDPLVPASLTDFEEFNLFLRQYRNRNAELIEQMYSNTNSFVDLLGTGLSFFANLIPTTNHQAAIEAKQQLTP